MLGHSERTAHASVPEEEIQSTVDRGAQSLLGSLDRGPSGAKDDDVSEEPLENDAVREAVKKKMKSKPVFGVFQKVLEKKAYDNPDAIIVDNRWVRVKRADGRMKCRLVA